MPDENKFDKLSEVGYTVRPCCGLCTHAQFGIFEWGTCAKHTYQHKKHTGDPRQMSINVHGCCKDDFKVSPEKLAKKLQSFIGFFTEE